MAKQWKAGRRTATIIAGGADVIAFWNVRHPRIIPWARKRASSLWIKLALERARRRV
jgi:hypothetical protein